MPVETTEFNVVTVQLSLILLTGFAIAWLQIEVIVTIYECSMLIVLWKIQMLWSSEQRCEDCLQQTFILHLSVPKKLFRLDSVIVASTQTPSSTSSRGLYIYTNMGTAKKKCINIKEYFLKNKFCSYIWKYSLVLTFFKGFTIF